MTRLEVFVFTPARNDIDYTILELTFDDIVFLCAGSFADVIGFDTQLATAPSRLFVRTGLPHTHARENRR